MDCDVFEDLRAALDCEYVSDLCLRGESNTRRAIAALDLSAYSLESLSELYIYLYGGCVAFRSHSEARRLFSETIEKERKEIK